MPKISALAALTGANLAAGDLFPVVDVSDLTMDTTGTDKKLTVANLATGLNTLALLTVNAATQIVGTGTVPPARLGSGTASAGTFLNGLGQWAAPAGGGDVLKAGASGVGLTLYGGDGSTNNGRLCLKANSNGSPLGAGIGLFGSTLETLRVRATDGSVVVGDDVGWAAGGNAAMVVRRGATAPAIAFGAGTILGVVGSDEYSPLISNGAGLVVHVNLKKGVHQPRDPITGLITTPVRLNSTETTGMGVMAMGNSTVYDGCIQAFSARMIQCVTAAPNAIIFGGNVVANNGNAAFSAFETGAGTGSDQNVTSITSLEGWEVGVSDRAAVIGDNPGNGIRVTTAGVNDVKWGIQVNPSIKTPSTFLNAYACSTDPKGVTGVKPWAVTGPYTITNAVWSAPNGGTITYTTAAAHGFVKGHLATIASITIGGTTNNGFNQTAQAVGNSDPDDGITPTTFKITGLANPGVTYVVGSSGGAVKHTHLVGDFIYTGNPLAVPSTVTNYICKLAHDPTPANKPATLPTVPATTTHWKVMNTSQAPRDNFLWYGPMGGIGTLRFKVDKDGNTLTAGTLQLVSTSGPKIIAGAGSPEGAISAPVGSLYLRTDDTSSPNLFVKQNGVGSTGWIVK